MAPVRANHSEYFETTSVRILRSNATIVLNVKFAGKDQMVSPIHVKVCCGLKVLGLCYQLTRPKGA